MQSGSARRAGSPPAAPGSHWRGHGIRLARGGEGRVRRPQARSRPLRVGSCRSPKDPPRLTSRSAAGAVSPRPHLRGKPLPGVTGGDSGRPRWRSRSRERPCRAGWSGSRPGRDAAPQPPPAPHLPPGSAAPLPTRPRAAPALAWSVAFPPRPAPPRPRDVTPGLPPPRRAPAPSSSQRLRGGPERARHGAVGLGLEGASLVPHGQSLTLVASISYRADHLLFAVARRDGQAVHRIRVAGPPRKAGGSPAWPWGRKSASRGASKHAAHPQRPAGLMPCSRLGAVSGRVPHGTIRSPPFPLSSLQAVVRPQNIRQNMTLMHVVVIELGSDSALFSLLVFPA